MTWRTADALPAPVMAQLREERAHLLESLRSAGREPTVVELAEVTRQFGERLDFRLDRGYGRCPLRDRRLADLVANALAHFDGDRYELYAWCVMPNHVHVVVEPTNGHALSEILHSWKSFTAHGARKLAKIESSLWQKESYDRVIRDEEELLATMRYVVDNPGRAGLVDWKWVWCREVRW